MPKILVKWPSRQRPALFFAALVRWVACLSSINPVHFLFSFDLDDVMTTREQMTKLADLFSAATVKAWASYSVVVGPKTRSKVQAINADVNDYTSRHAWDLLILASDDMVPLVTDFDQSMIRAIPTPAPAGDEPITADTVLSLGDYAVNPWDGHRLDPLCTLAVMTRTYYERFRYIYHPSYESLWCDNEWTDVARALGRLIDIPRPVCLVEHQHPVNGKQWAWDDLYRIGCSTGNFAKDKANYEKRKAAGAMGPPQMPSTSPGPRKRSQPILSILIATLKEREEKFQALCTELSRQNLLLDDPELVEVLHMQDQGSTHGGLIIGDKRQRLLDSANGDYVCFIDDDDLVEPTYVADICHALLATYAGDAPKPDCAVFQGRLTDDGRYAGTFDFDLSHMVYRTVGTMYMRTPNHLCPIRRDIAQRVGFNKVKRLGEDNEYAQRIFRELRTQIVIKDSTGAKKLLYHYRFSKSGTRTQRQTDKDQQAKELAGTNSNPSSTELDNQMKHLAATGK